MQEPLATPVTPQGIGERTHMAGISVSPAGDFSFVKDGKYLDNRLAVDIKVAATGAAAALLAADLPFPAGKTEVGGLSASVGGKPSDVKFDSGHGTVTFSGSAHARSALAVYDNTATLLQDLDPDPARKILDGLKLEGDGAAQFVLLDWGYDISASGKGSVALGGGANATFAADGSTGGLFAAIRGFATPPPSREAIQSTIASWMPPRQVGSVDDLEPGTWLVAEVDGSIGVKIGAQYGYSFNWIRQVNLGSLSGDVGLKIQAAVDAAVRFDASGKYLVLVARESVKPDSRIVRVQVFKMAKKGWAFAFDANVGVTGSTGTLLPAQIDDFVAAVFGVNGAQLVEDLKQFDKWTDPKTPLPDMLSGFIADFVTRELGHIAGGEIEKYEEARKRIAAFLGQWDNLGHGTSTLLWSAIQKGGGLAPALLSFLQQTNGSDDASLVNSIESALGKAGLSASPIGQWLESVTASDVMGVLGNSSSLARVREAAQNALALSGGNVLDTLVKFAAEKLNVGAVEQIVDEAQFANLDPWLKKKLTRFLGQQHLLIADLDRIRATARAVRDKAGELYTQAIKALNSKYAAAFHYTYSKTTMSTALMDVSFDFAKDPGVGPFLKMAIQGDFKDLLLAASPGITLRKAALTYGVTRQSHIQIALPFFRADLDHINEALARMDVTEDRGKLFVYDLHAKDAMIRAQKWASDLTITGNMTVAPGVRTFVSDAEIADSMTFSYGFRQAAKNLRDVQFEDLLQPLVGPYFSKVFGGPAAPDAASLHEWIGDLDNQATAVGGTGTGDLGNVLYSLDVSLPGKVVAAWLNAPADARAEAYFAMSRNIQQALRRYAQYCYFNDPARYADIDAAPAVFVYGCLPVSSNIAVHDDGTLTLNLPDQPYWNFEDPRSRQAMVFAELTKSSLASRMAGIQRVLQDSPKFRSSAQFYGPDSLDRVRQTALQSPSFAGLLFTEAQTIRHAGEAAMNLAKFRANAKTDPQQAIQALESFGSKITDAFNHGLGSLVPRLQEFSTMIFLEAARALVPELAGAHPIARLDTILLRSGTPQSVSDAFLRGSAPDAAAIALEQPVLGL